MLDKLDFMVRFWSLRARHEAGAALTPLERGELLSLLSLMVIDDPMPEPVAAPPGEGLPIQITARGGFLAADLRHVCSAGLVVVTEASLSVGQSTVARVNNVDRGVTYTMPCVVEWIWPGARATVALRVNGAPTRMLCTTLDAWAWASPLGWLDEPVLPAA